MNARERSPDARGCGGCAGCVRAGRMDARQSYDRDADEVKRCYQQAAKNAHPDKGGSHDSFVRINEAFQVMTEGQ